jgi:hypothetical protein
MDDLELGFVINWKEKNRTEPDSLKTTYRNPSISINVSSKVDEVQIPLTIFHPQVNK